MSRWIRWITSAAFVAVMSCSQLIASASWLDLDSASMPVSSAQLLPPTGVAAGHGACVPSTSASVVVSWTPTASTAADGYEIFRSTTSGGPYASAGTVSGRTTSSFTDPHVAFATTYHYVVQSKRIGWRSASSNEASITTRSPLCL